MIATSFDPADKLIRNRQLRRDYLAHAHFAATDHN
jgi:hypothetical protein